jgi:hypothetical protein
MNAAVIKIKYANPPKDGKKQASVRTEDNQIFGVWPDKFGLLQPGRTYQVEYKERVFEGKTYRTIVKCEPVKDVEEPPSGLAQSSQRSSQKDGEVEFVARLLAASISACAVAHKEESLIAEARMLRSVYREAFK